MLESDSDSRIAVGARLDGRPVGLALALWEPDSPQVRLLSLMVAPELRCRGIGSRILRRCEDLAAATGRPRLATYFSSILPDAGAFAATLAKTGWSAPALLELRCAVRAGETATAIAGWPGMERRLASRDDVAFTPWNECVSADLARIADLAGAADCPPGLTPTHCATEIDPEESFVLRQGGEVVGWILARLDRDAGDDPPGAPTLFISAAYIRRDLWRSGLLVLAYHFMACRHVARFGSDAPARFSTSPKYPGMMALIRRRFAPAAVWVDEWLEAGKQLDG